MIYIQMLGQDKKDKNVFIKYVLIKSAHSNLD